MIDQQACLQDLETAFLFLARLDDDAMACFRSEAVELFTPRLGSRPLRKG